ncbi:hypothetical protein RhiJN_09288 [Ceratobasidium sp. AG-Ba]|nr:hypothetical protein RhiJN_09288 [Ceratobasidium sp. AG-Ba]QRW10047.1 hypothetical protein RhiLY_09046 [Ceratobasidium sp. AG-Ba]
MSSNDPIDISYLHPDASLWPAGPRQETHLALLVSGVGAEAVSNKPEYFEWTAGAKLAALESWKRLTEAPLLLYALWKPDDDNVGTHGWKTGGN